MDKVFIKRFKQVLLFGGFFNIIFSVPLVFPGLSDYYLIFLSRVNDALRLGGQIYITSSNPLHSFFINTAGIDLVVIGLTVLHAAADPIARRGIVLLNAIGRILFVGIVAYYVLAENVARIVMFFTVIDFAISVVYLCFLSYYRRNRQNLYAST